MPTPALILYLAMLVLAWFIAIRLTIRSKKDARISIGAGLSVAALGCVAILRPDIWVRLVPWHDALFISNLFPVAAAFLLPPLFRLLKTRAQQIRLGVLAAILFTLSLRETAQFFAPPARSKLTWIDRDGICRQSSRETCSAAALVTLLHLHGIQSSENEIADLAWTRQGQGTAMLGLYRALNLKAATTNGLKPALLQIDADRLIAEGKPAVITVGLARVGNSKEAAEFGAAYEWSPGALHDVVFMGRSSTKPGHVKIGEPDFGLEEWPEEHLRYLHRGFAITLESVATP